MVRPKKVLASARQKEEDASEAALMVQSRSRRTIKPNPKYNSKEILPLKQLGSGDEDDEDDDEHHDPNQSTEDDEDFRDDGAKDSDAEDSPPTRRRGRPVVAPRSEPQPPRKLQQLRAGLSMSSASKIMQATGISSATLDKKRKIDYDDDAELDEPSSKRKPVAVTPISTRVGTRLAAAVPQQQKMTQSPANTGKENASLLGAAAAKKEGPAKTAATPVRPSPSPIGITTRRQQATTISTGTGTPSPKPTSGIILRTQGTVGSSAATAKEGSMIQVRRATPMVSQTTTPSPIAKTPSPVVQPKAAPVTRERVLLNRTPVVKPKPAVPVPASGHQSPATVLTRTLATRQSAQGKSSPSPSAFSAKTPVNRILNALPSSASTSPSTAPKAVITVPADAELEPFPGDPNKTRVTTIEKRFVIRVEPEPTGTKEEPLDLDPAKPSVSLLKLRSEIRALKMPTELWSYQMKLHAHRGKADPALEVPDKPGYMVHSVVLNRLVPSTTTPKLLNGQKVDQRQFDRSVELLKNQYNVTINGRSVKLLGAPRQVVDMEEVETLLEIVNHVSIESPVVKLAV